MAQLLGLSIRLSEAAHYLEHVDVGTFSIGLGIPTVLQREDAAFRPVKAQSTDKKQYSFML